MLIRDQFLECMSHAASTVSIVTTNGPLGRAGVTVSAMCSVSADPPSLLVCVNQTAKSCEAIRGNGVLCVNVLRDDQFYVSDTFAGVIETEDGDKFSCATWKTNKTGAPVLDRALAAFDCKISSYVQSGSHLIFMAEVQAIEAGSGHPLIYAERAYGTPLKLDSFLPERSLNTDREVVNIGCYVTLGPFFMPQVLRGFLQENAGVQIKIHEGAQDTLVAGLESRRFDLALMYDVGMSSDITVSPLTEMEPHVLLAAGHPLTQLSKISLADLAPEPMVLLDIPPSREYFTSLFSSHGLEPKIEFYSPSFEMVRGMVGNGLGYALLITKPANATSYDGKALTSRPIAEKVPCGKVVITHLTGQEPRDPVRRFSDYCKQFFKAFDGQKK